MPRAARDVLPVISCRQAVRAVQGGSRPTHALLRPLESGGSICGCVGSTAQKQIDRRRCSVKRRGAFCKLEYKSVSLLSRGKVRQRSMIVTTIRAISCHVFPSKEMYRTVCRQAVYTYIEQSELKQLQETPEDRRCKQTAMAKGT